MKMIQQSAFLTPCGGMQAFSTGRALYHADIGAVRVRRVSQ
jgi:hypothetical protein